MSSEDTLKSLFQKAKPGEIYSISDNGTSKLISTVEPDETCATLRRLAAQREGSQYAGKGSWFDGQVRIMLACNGRATAEALSQLLAIAVILNPGQNPCISSNSSPKGTITIVTGSGAPAASLA